jgi:inorganic pyrophosphatase
MAKSRKSAKGPASPTRINPFSDKKNNVVNAVIETPGGSRNKFKYDEHLGCFTLSGILPEGMVFPHAFGFVPSTRAADGDPEDILLLMDEPSFAGCVVPSRLIGVMEAEQTEQDGTRERNDRLIAVAAQSYEYSEIATLGDLDKHVLKQIEQFFINYNKEKGKKFRVLQMRGPKQAMKLLKNSLL